MKLVIDNQVCLRHKVTMEEALIMLAVKYMELDDISNLEARGILTEAHGLHSLTEQWERVLNRILTESSAYIKEDRLKALAVKMQKCFPEGKMPGTPYYYRCNTSEVVKKLEKFFLKYGDFTDDDIIDATKRFVASFNANYKYLPLIKYFISKLKPVQEEDGTVHNVEYSPLADFLENKEAEDTVVSNSDDWLMSARN